MGPQSCRSPNFCNFEPLTWESRDNCHLNVGLVERHIVYYKGEGGGFSQVWVVVSLVNPSCPWLVLAPKVLQLCINHLVLVLCRFMWIVEACQFFLVPSRSSNMPLYPSKVLRARECASTPYSSDVFNLDSHLSPSRSWERIKHIHLSIHNGITHRWIPNSHV